MATEFAGPLRQVGPVQAHPLTDWRGRPTYTGPMPRAAALVRAIGVRRVYGASLDYGTGTLTNTVKKHTDTADLPVARRVRVFRDSDGKLLGETWSHPTTGVYTFRDLPLNQPLSVVAYDYEHDKRAAIADNLLATPPAP